MTSKEHGTLFHKRIEKLLRKSGFIVLKSNINTKGPDIIAEVDGVKIIVECKKSIRNKKYGSLEHLVDSYTTKVKKYNAKRAIIALSGYTNNLSDKKLNDWLINQNVAIWNDPLILNYETLTKSIHNFTKYQILGDLNLDYPFKGTKIIAPALNLKQHHINLFITALKPADLLKMCFVARRAQGMLTYQRYLSKKRVVHELPDFIEGEKGVIPNNLILVSKKRIVFNNNKLILDPLIASFWVIDGQHRLYAFCNIKDLEKRKDYKLICTIFDGSKIKPQDQAEIFLTINTKAKKPEPPLIVELAKSFGFDYEPRATEIYKKFENSQYFYNKIRSYSNKNGTIDSNTFVKSAALKELLSDNGPILKFKRKLSEKRKVELCYRYLFNFFKVVYANFKKEWTYSKRYILGTNQGYRTLLKLYIQMLKNTAGKNDIKKIRTIIKALKRSGTDLLIVNLKGKYAGEGGAQQLAHTWAVEINKTLPGFIKKKNEGEVLKIERIYRGHLESAEQFMEECSRYIKKNVYAELMYIDSSTIDYIKKYFSHCINYYIVFSGMHKEDKSKIAIELQKIRADGKCFVLTKCSKIHERWLADDNHCIEINTDLKKNALANCDHDIKLIEFNTNSPRIERFKENWEKYKTYSERSIIFDWDLHKEDKIS